MCSLHFASLFFKSKGEHLWNKEKTVLFYFKSSFRSRENQILRVLDIQISWRHQMPKHKTRKTFYWITWEVNTVCWWNFPRLCHNTKEKKYIKKIYKNCSLKASPRPFCASKELGITSTGKYNFWTKLFTSDMLE